MTGATALSAAVEDNVVKLSWNYLPIVLASCLIMLGWACLIDNLGRRRYTLYWWSPSSTWVRGEDSNEKEEHLKTLEEGKMRSYEDGGRLPVDLLEERLEEKVGKWLPLNMPGRGIGTYGLDGILNVEPLALLLNVRRYSGSCRLMSGSDRRS